MNETVRCRDGSFEIQECYYNSNFSLRRRQYENWIIYRKSGLKSDTIEVIDSMSANIAKVYSKYGVRPLHPRGLKLRPAGLYMNGWRISGLPRRDYPSILMEVTQHNFFSMHRKEWARRYPHYLTHFMNFRGYE